MHLGGRGHVVDADRVHLLAGLQVVVLEVRRHIPVVLTTLVDAMRQRVHELHILVAVLLHGRTPVPHDGDARVEHPDVSDTPAVLCSQLQQRRAT